MVNFVFLCVVAGDGQHSYFYGGQELEYAYFVHSIHLLSRILCYNNGRSLFPVKVKDRDGEFIIIVGAGN